MGDLISAYIYIAGRWPTTYDERWAGDVDDEVGGRCQCWRLSTDVAGRMGGVMQCVNMRRAMASRWRDDDVDRHDDA